MKEREEWMNWRDIDFEEEEKWAEMKIEEEVKTWGRKK